MDNKNNLKGIDKKTRRPIWLKPFNYELKKSFKTSFKAFILSLLASILFLLLVLVFNLFPFLPSFDIYLLVKYLIYFSVLIFLISFTLMFLSGVVIAQKKARDLSIKIDDMLIADKLRVIEYNNPKIAQTAELMVPFIFKDDRPGITYKLYKDCLRANYAKEHAVMNFVDLIAEINRRTVGKQVELGVIKQSDMDEYLSKDLTLAVAIRMIRIWEENNM